MGYIRGFEGENCSDNAKGETNDEPGQRINFTDEDNEWQNDEVKSLQLMDVRVGAQIRVYDHPEGRASDDWTEIVVLSRVQIYCLGTLERTFEDEVVRVTYHDNNGLDGKVSRLEVD